MDVEESKGKGAVSATRFALGVAWVAIEVTLVVLLGTGGVKFFYQGF